uniref:Vacuolar protein sorting-associated protein 29 n=1 Tax=Xenopus tropicalis TaxID=8364 RepID=F6SHT7_XENTR
MSEVGGGGGRRRLLDEEFTLQVYPGSIAQEVIYWPVPARRHTTAADVIDTLITALRLDRAKCYVLAEVKEFGGEEWILNPSDCPVQRMMLWPRLALEARGSGEDYRFLLREKNMDGSIHYGSLQSWLRVTEERRHMVERGFLPQQQGPECEDLCGLPDLSERALLETLRTRFRQEKIYTYVGTILVAVNPFRFLPIYNPKYVKMYDNRRLGDREPHIYAVADAAYHAMLRRQRNQCIVISGETGSGKTQSTNFLIHHLTALSQKGYASGVEQIILGAGPVLEAFGNAKTYQNNNSSRFGKFIQVNYHETGTVRGAYVEKYLLEKSRLVYQEQQERNYHVFYYLLAGASEEEKAEFHLEHPESYHYLNQVREGWRCYLRGEGEDLRHDFERLQLAMEMVGFMPATRRQIVSLLSAILHLGNIQYKRKTYRDESIDISNPETLNIVSELLKVREEMLLDALITRKTVTVGEKLILPYRLPEAITVRDSLAKSLYSALFDWIVFRINHALLNINSKAIDEGSQTLSIGVLDIFGFEDYGTNSFEQFCINYANERLQHYFNQHLFQLEQELYRSEGISWSNITYSDNGGCINLISKKPTGLLQLLDEESNFPQATHQTLLEKFKRHNERNPYIEFPAVMEPAFIIHHYAGKVKYGVKDFREKNTDHMRPDIVALLRSSRNAFIRGMISISPVGAFRWALLRAFFRAVEAFKQSGKSSSKKTGISSFSFLQHPVHQRSLQILQSYPYSIKLPAASFELINYFREMSWTSRRQNRLSSSNSYLEGGGIFISSSSSNQNNSTDSKLLERGASGSSHLLDVKSLKHLSNLTLHDRITKSLLHHHKKKKPPSISAQFQTSLNKLMETLGQAEPYFVKCIRSNAEKVPMRFDDALVLRQLRYTGMLETVRIRQSGYSCKYPFQDFVTQFSVLLPKDISPVHQSIKEFFWRIGHSPDQYQVGRTMVFLKEQERQCLMEMLHQTVLQRIILLQRWIRARLQRKRFLLFRDAVITIQRCWRHYKRRWIGEEPPVPHTLIPCEAACIIQSWWRCRRTRLRFLKTKNSVLVIQNCWREHNLKKQRAAVSIQSWWRASYQKSLYQRKLKCIIVLQAASRGYLARYKGSEPIRLTAHTPDMNCTHLQDSASFELPGQQLLDSSCSADLNTIPVEVHIRERPKSLENPNQRTVFRAKRESRRLRELEQAQFSLELLKVRSGGISPSEERRWSGEVLDKLVDTPESDSSVFSLELINPEENLQSPKDPPTHPSASEIIPSSPTDTLAKENASFHHTPSAASIAVDISQSSWRQKPQGFEISESAPAKSSLPVFNRTHTREPLLSSSLPTFYLPQQETVRTQKLTETGEIPTESVLQRLQKLNEEKEQQQKQLQQEKERQMMEQIRQEKQELERQRRIQETQEPEKIPLGTSKRISDRPQSLLIQSSQQKSPPTKPTVEIKGLSIGGKCDPQVSQNDRPISKTVGGQDPPCRDPVGEARDTGKRPWLHTTGNSTIFFNPKGNISNPDHVPVISFFHPHVPCHSVCQAPHRRKARMARTRSDIMTRGALGGADSEEESDDQGELNLPTNAAEEAGRLSQACHSDSEMMLQRVQGGDKASRLHKAVSQGEIYTSSSLYHFRPQKGKIRFWGKLKASEKLTTPSEILEMDVDPSGKDCLWLVPHSPDLSRGREKENKDPSPKVQRRRSLKISSAGLEPVQWQHEHAQIICSASDLKCMDEFLQKKIGDLDSEDGKKDSLVDVLFKRALKEFRQNIFSLYSTSLMVCGKSIRYRDLGALFEQILDKTMKQQHPRSWSESPLRVWINTFKVFLDEFVTEYKPLNYTPGKIQKTERKKRRKKDSDIVEEHNGHIFKITQYNIPTYCEYCSSLIWIMDRAAVCKLCRYACHKKCCSLINVACNKKNDSELSTRQFGVDLSRLTNEERLVPVLLEKLISYIEMHGLYTEGIYRKPGSTNKIRELRQSLDTDIENVNLDDYNIHVIASVFKQWLRELPNPLMTFELYEEFLRSMGLGERKETVRGVYSVVDQLSRTHLITLERLIFHLVRIAQQEETNRMSANALAIVFAPCILRCPDTTDPLQSVQDIGKTTACVELIVVEQMNKYRARLKDINSLEFAENKAKSRLSLIRRSMKPVLIAVRFMSINRSSLPGKGRLRPGLSPVISGLSTAATDAAGDHSLSSIPSEEESPEQKEAAMQQEERILAQQIETLQKEKEELAYEMLALEPRASDDETLESEASLGTADSSENLNCESEGAVLGLSSGKGSRSELTRARRQAKRDMQSTDTRDRNLSSPTASSCLPQLGRKRFHLHPFYRAQGDSRESAPASAQDPGAPLHFTSRGTFNPEKGRQKLKSAKQSPQKPRDTPDGGEHKILGPDGSSQSIVLFGSNEFMV